MQKLGHWLLAHHRNAIIVAFVCVLLAWLSMAFALLAMVIVGLVTLRKGYKAGLFILFWIAVPAVSLLYLGRVNGYDALLLLSVAVWFFAVVYARYQSLSLVFEVATVIGFLVVIGFHLTLPDVHQWWASSIMHYIKENNLSDVIKLSPNELAVVVDNAARMSTGIVVDEFIVFMFIGLALARAWQGALFEPGLFGDEFRQLYFNRVVAIVFMLVVIGCFLKVDLLLDFFPVIFLPFVFAGLSMLHLLVQKNKWLLILLSAVYVAMLFLPIVPLFLLGAFGYFDSWINFRKQFSLLANKT